MGLSHELVPWGENSLVGCEYCVRLIYVNFYLLIIGIILRTPGQVQVYALAYAFEYIFKYMLFSKCIYHYAELNIHYSSL